MVLSRLKEQDFAAVQLNSSGHSISGTDSSCGVGCKSLFEERSWCNHQHLNDEEVTCNHGEIRGLIRRLIIYLDVSY